LRSFCGTGPKAFAEAGITHRDVDHLMHSGMYGIYALQESVRQMRGIALAQVTRLLGTTQPWSLPEPRH
jgi:hypothetical protein